MSRGVAERGSECSVAEGKAVAIEGAGRYALLHSATPCLLPSFTAPTCRRGLAGGWAASVVAAKLGAMSQGTAKAPLALPKASVASCGVPLTPGL